MQEARTRGRRRKRNGYVTEERERRYQGWTSIVASRHVPCVLRVESASIRLIPGPNLLIIAVFLSSGCAEKGAGSEGDRVGSGTEKGKSHQRHSPGQQREGESVIRNHVPASFTSRPHSMRPSSLPPTTARAQDKHKQPRPSTSTTHLDPFLRSVVAGERSWPFPKLVECQDLCRLASL
jgi:hypothetical protein